MLRLVRLLSFIKNVPQLRVILGGLVSGLQSVTWILTLLFLIIYLFAILGCLFLGENDPAHFGTVPIAMLSLFQVSTLASWTTIAYTSWFGCERYQGGQYALPTEERSSGIVATKGGNFQAFQCNGDVPRPMFTFCFFSVYIMITSWVIMTLFIGVISMGMFEAYEKNSEERKRKRYRERLEANRGMEASMKEAAAIAKAGLGPSKQHSASKLAAAKGGGKKKGPRSARGGGRAELDAEAAVFEAEHCDPMLKVKIDRALKDDISWKPPELWWERRLQGLFDVCAGISRRTWFQQLVTWTIVLAGVLTGIEVCGDVGGSPVTIRGVRGDFGGSFVGSRWCLSESHDLKSHLANTINEQTN